MEGLGLRPGCGRSCRGRGCYCRFSGEAAPRYRIGCRITTALWLADPNVVVTNEAALLSTGVVFLCRVPAVTPTVAGRECQLLHRRRGHVLGCLLLRSHCRRMSPIFRSAADTTRSCHGHSRPYVAVEWRISRAIEPGLNFRQEGACPTAILAHSSSHFFHVSVLAADFVS